MLFCDKIYIFEPFWMLRVVTDCVVGPIRSTNSGSTSSASGETATEALFRISAVHRATFPNTRSHSEAAGEYMQKSLSIWCPPKVCLPSCVPSAALH